MASIAALRADLAAAEADAITAEYCDDVTATMPGGVLSRAWERVRRARSELADAELAEAMGDPTYQRIMRRAEARA